MNSQKALRDLDTELRGGGTLESHGVFTVALDKAREKLQKFQLPDPRFYILQLIQGIIASGARTIDVSMPSAWTAEEVTPGYRVRIEWDGPGYTFEELSRLYDFIFESQQDRTRDRLREVALGILSCQALRVGHIQIASGSSLWTWSPKEQGVVRPSEPTSRNRIEILRWGEPTEVQLLREHCQCVPIPLRVDGEPISATTGFGALCPWPVWLFEVGGMKGAIGLPYAGLTQSRLMLLRHGVRISKKVEKKLTPPVAIVCEHPGLRKNASQSDVVEDETYQTFLVDLQKIMIEFAREFATRKVPAYQWEGVQTYLLQLVREWLPTEMLLGPLDQVPSDLAPLLDLPLFTDVKARRRTLREVAEQVQKAGFVGISERRLPHADLKEWVVLSPSTVERDTLTVLFEDLQNVDDQIRFVLSGGEGKSQRVRPKSPSRGVLAEVQIQRDGDPAVGGRLVASGSQRTYISLTSVGPTTWTLAILDAFPTTQSTFLIEGQTEQHLSLKGLCLECTVKNPVWNLPETLRLAYQVVAVEAPALYDKLLRGYLTARKDSEQSGRHVREHLLCYANYRIDVWLTEASADRTAGCRSVLGEEWWNTPLFDTRSGSPVSLADIETWLRYMPTLAVAFGGSHLAGDHSLDASPAVVAFLSRVFGLDHVLEATFTRGLLDERLLQEELPYATQHLTGPVQRKQVEEETLEDLGRDLRSAMESSEPSPVATEVPEVAAVPTVEVAAPRLEVAVLPAPEVAALPAPEVAALPVLEAPPASPLPESRATPGADYQIPEDALAQQAFSQGGVSGLLVVTPRADESVAITSQGKPIGSQQLFGLPMGGWIDIPEEITSGGLRVWSVNQKEVLWGQMRALFDCLALAMSAMPPHDNRFVAGRSALIKFLTYFVSSTQQRLHEAAAADPVAQLRFLPMVGGSLANLATLWHEAEQNGALTVSRDGSPAPSHRLVALVGPFAPELFYQAIFPRVLDEDDRVPTEPPSFRLVAAVQRELRLLRERGDFRLSDAILNGIALQPGNGGLVTHDPDSGVTLINSRHRLIRRSVKACEKDPTVVTLLVSAIYTAINRALQSVDDRDELEFLAALLESSGEEH